MRFFRKARSAGGLLDVLRRFGRDAGGASAIEYALIAAGISIVIAGTVYQIGGEVTTLFETVEKAVKPD